MKDYIILWFAGLDTNHNIVGGCGTVGGWGLTTECYSTGGVQGVLARIKIYNIIYIILFILNIYYKFEIIELSII